MAAYSSIEKSSPVETIGIALAKADKPLPFEIELVSGSKIRTIGEAQKCLLRFRNERASHWQLASGMFRKAMNQPEYLKLATMSLETAFALERVLASPRVPRTGDDPEHPRSLPQGPSWSCVEPTRALLGRLLEVLEQGEEPDLSSA